MKKFFVLIAVLTAICFNVNAQNHVEPSKTWENWFISGGYGGVIPFESYSENGLKDDYHHLLNLEVGKMITPVVGWSIEWNGAFNHLKHEPIMDQSNLKFNAIVNLNNWFGGYKGQPYLCEVSLVPGIGWGHDVKWHGDDYGYNYLTYNGFVNVAFNMGKQRAWQIYVKPGVVFAAREGVYDMHKSLGMFQCNVGVTYKFNNKKKQSHNFVMCDYTVKQEDYDKVVAQRDSLEKIKPDTVIVEKVKEPCCNNHVVVVKTSPTNVTFKTGTSKLTQESKQNIKSMAATTKDYARNVIVVGSADSGTGTKEINEKLAKQRADNVANELKENGIKVNEIKTVMDIYGDNEMSRTAVVFVQ